MCISIQQPWAEFVVAGLKNIENRSWSSTFSGALIIHAGKKIDINWRVKSTYKIGQIGSQYLAKKNIATKGMFKLQTSAFVGAVIMTGCTPFYCSPWCHESAFFHLYTNAIKFPNPFRVVAS